jgi:membrane protease YdiL (CAAX protease family)
MFIGVPMMLISFAVTRKKESLRCLLGGFGMSTTAVVLILISGVIFGLAHSSGWDGQAWKILTTAIMGIFLGYLFVRFGLYAAILLHFITDYFQAFYWMGVGALGGLASLLLLGIGLVSLIYIMLRLARSKEAIASLPAFRNEHVR